MKICIQIHSNTICIQFKFTTNIICSTVQVVERKRSGLHEETFPPGYVEGEGEGEGNGEGTGEGHEAGTGENNR